MNTQNDTVSWRQYSVAEIDRMRAAIDEIETSKYTAPYLVGDHEAGVETLLRTYMIGGVGPEELEARAEEIKRQKDERYAARKVMLLAIVQRYDLRATFLGEKRLSSEEKSSLMMGRPSFTVEYPRTYWMR